MKMFFKKVLDMLAYLFVYFSFKKNNNEIN